MLEFTVVLTDDDSFDIYIDNERVYFGLTPEDLKEFAENLIFSNNFDE